jgi:hypothetical protein
MKRRTCTRQQTDGGIAVAVSVAAPETGRELPRRRRPAAPQGWRHDDHDPQILPRSRENPNQRWQVRGIGQQEVRPVNRVLVGQGPSAHPPRDQLEDLVSEQMTTITNTTPHEVWVISSRGWRNSELLYCLQPEESMTATYPERTELFALHADGSPALVKAENAERRPLMPGGGA